MVDEELRCPSCHEGVSAADTRCPYCGAALDALPERPPPSAVRVDPPAGARTALTAREPAVAPDLARRFSKLQQWAEMVDPLGLTLPVLPRWAEEAARRTSDHDRWADVLTGVERLAQNQILAALEEWQRDVKTRLTRLEAYAVDSRLERDQMDDALHFAKTGDISRALTAYQQVDRVITLKERHLDTAREDLESVVSLLRDMAGVGLAVPSDPNELGQELERELRSGRLASLKQQLRVLRTQAMEAVQRELPGFVSRYGDFLQEQRMQGTPVETEIAELGRGARLLAQGRSEEALHRMRRLLQMHGSSTFRPSRTAAVRGAP
ncbi:MAG: zinc ribbon domain-containing protein [Thermoplasmata archaeon]